MISVYILAKTVFCEVTASLSFDQPKSHQTVLESNWMFVQNLKKKSLKPFLKCRIKENGMNGWTDKQKDNEEA